MQGAVHCKVELLRPHDARSAISTACTSTSASVCCSPSWRLTHRHVPHLRLPASRHVVRAAAEAPAKVDLDRWVEESRRSREQWLEESALGALKTAVEAFERPAFPCALIAGDVVILNLLHRLGYLESGRVPIIFIDTFHLFPETHAFLHRLEEKYGFKAHVFQAAGFTNVAEFKKVHGSDLFIRDIEEYDQICKVEPFQRSLQELQVDVMINGRRRDHGFERAQLEVFEGGLPVKVNPLAWWEFKDCMQYLERNGLERHPLHDQGYPSIGDVQSTVPVPVEKWYEYAGERSGRFQGLQNPDGSLKTECGIHVAEDVKGPISKSPTGTPSTATPNNPPTNSGSVPPTSPSKRGRPRGSRSRSEGPGFELVHEWLRTKTAILPGSCITTLDGCYKSYCTRVSGVHSAVPLTRTAFSAALRAALAAEADAGRVAFLYVGRKEGWQRVVRGLHVDDMTVDVNALLEEWFHARVAFDLLGGKVALSAFYDSFRNFFLPCCGVDGERWAAVARTGRNTFCRQFRTFLAAEGGKRVYLCPYTPFVRGVVLV